MEIGQSYGEAFERERALTSSILARHARHNDRLHVWVERYVVAAQVAARLSCAVGQALEG